MPAPIDGVTEGGRPASARVEVSRTPPELSIERRAPQVRWDRSDYQGAVGVLPSDELGRALRDRARAAALEGAGRIAEEGRLLGAIEHGHTIGTVARGRPPQDERRLTLAAVPPPVRTTEDPGGVRTRVRPGELRIEARLATTGTEMERGRVTVHTEVPSRINAHA